MNKNQEIIVVDNNDPGNDTRDIVDLQALAATGGKIQFYAAHRSANMYKRSLPENVTVISAVTSKEFRPESDLPVYKINEIGDVFLGGTKTQAQTKGYLKANPEMVEILHRDLDRVTDNGQKVAIGISCGTKGVKGKEVPFEMIEKHVFKDASLRDKVTLIRLDYIDQVQSNTSENQFGLVAGKASEDSKLTVYQLPKVNYMSNPDMMLGLVTALKERGVVTTISGQAAHLFCAATSEKLEKSVPGKGIALFHDKPFEYWNGKESEGFVKHFQEKEGVPSHEKWVPVLEKVAAQISAFVARHDISKELVRNDLGSYVAALSMKADSGKQIAQDWQNNNQRSK